MKILRICVVCSVFLTSFAAFAQNLPPVYFVPRFKQGERLIYKMVETKFKQNLNGHYLELMYDTSYMVFNITEKNDTQTLIDFNYAHTIINNEPYNEVNFSYPNRLQTETYKIVLDYKGEFVELANWEFFGNILVENLKNYYLNNMLDSNTLKYYYLHYKVQENVEKAVIPRLLEIFDIFGKTYYLGNSYSLAREMVNPFGGKNLLKSCTFKPDMNVAFPNSVFFEGKIKTNDVDNDCLQEDYFALMNERRPDAESNVEPPYIFMIDTYKYQWGILNDKLLKYTTTHTVWMGQEKQGLDREIVLFSN